MKRFTWRLLTAADMERCGTKPSRRSTARCEMPPDHRGIRGLAADFHCGRTVSGRWKSWPAGGAA